MMLDDLLERFKALPPDRQADLRKTALAATSDLIFIPSPGPQTQAYYSKADVLLFGGSPGGGKSALEIGLALNCHYRSLIVRKQFSDLEGLVDNAKRIVGTSKGFVGGARPKYSKPNGGVIHFAGLPQDGGVGGHQGVDHDLLCIDEAATVPEDQVRMMMAWVRTDRPGQRCRIVFASNPPLDSTGDWLSVMFAPWLDPNHPNPAGYGELRYFLPGDDGKDVECGSNDTAEISGVKVRAQSRTYIPSSFTDNPYINGEEYTKSLAAMPERQREVLITGNFMLARTDPMDQLIPTDWVKAAQSRWGSVPKDGIPMCAMGVDVAQGGSDDTVIACRYDGWYAPLIVVPGKETPYGSDVATHILRHRRDGALPVVDMGGGYGSGVAQVLRDNGIKFAAYKGANGSSARTADRAYGFANTRSEAYWRFREALNPDQPHGSPIMLPDDAVLRSELTAHTYTIGTRGVAVENKEDVCRKLGRSPDRADAVVMAWWAGQKGLLGAAIYTGPAHRVREPRSFGTGAVKVNLGYENRRRK